VKSGESHLFTAGVRFAGAGAGVEPKDAPETRDVIRNGYQSPYIHDSEAAFLRANVKSVRFFDSNDKFNEDSHDALAIIERG
jgi:hypothetical protein